MTSKVRAFLTRHYKDLLIILVLILALEWWQSRRLLRGELPLELQLATAQTLDDESARLWNQDRTTLLYVFAPWCGVCRTSASNMNRLPGSIHTASLALSWSDQQSVEDFIERSGLKTKVLLGTAEQGQGLGVQAFPSYVLVSSDGRIIYSWTGYTTSFGLWLRSLIGHWFLA